MGIGGNLGSGSVVGRSFKVTGVTGVWGIGDETRGIWDTKLGTGALVVNAGGSVPKDDVGIS